MSEKWIFFIDTNVFLDFYRMPGASVKRQLDELEAHVDRLIIGDQIRMEFLKNRQKVLLKSIRELKAPVGERTIPQAFSEVQAAKMMTKHLKTAQDRFKDLKEKAEKMLSDPAHNDLIYASFNRLIAVKSGLNLTRPNKVRIAVREKAENRFKLGYPPRKSEDTSFGDAVNWEWILECACEHEDKPHVMIVSRDSDYGIQTDKGTYLNDWLAREFKERVSKKRKIQLTTKLTDALKLMNATVTQEDEDAEQAMFEKSGSALDYTPDEWRIFQLNSV